MQTFHKSCLFVRLAVVVGVFQDDQFVVGFGVAGFVVWITGHGGHPKPTFVVEGHLHRVGQVGKFCLGSKKFYFVPIRHFEFVQCIFAVEVFQAAIFFGVKIGFDIWQTAGCFIRSGKVCFFSLLCCQPNCLVANGRYLADFFDFGGVVIGAKRCISATIHVYTVGDFVVVVPHPVFFHHHFSNQVAIRFGFGRGIAKNFIAQQFGQLLIPCFIELSSIDGQWFSGVAVPLLGGSKGIDKLHLVLLGHCLHGIGVKQEVFVLFFPIRQIVDPR